MKKTHCALAALVWLTLACSLGIPAALTETAIPGATGTNAPQPTDASTEPSGLTPALTPAARALTFLKKVDIAGGARPEIIAAADRVFVVYLDVGPPTSFRVKIFDADLTQEIAAQTLVTTTSQYGNPTDIRVVSDGEYLYAFYETADMRTAKTTYLWGAKYRLTDDFARVAYASNPIAQSRTFDVQQEGDEKLDDPAPVIGPHSVFAVTRIKTSLETSGATIYRVREFSYDLQTEISEFDLDLSAVADGGARQASALYHDGSFYLVVPSTVGPSPIPGLDLAYPADLVLVRLDAAWQIIESKTISAVADYNETYVTGFQTDGDWFYLVHNEIKIGVELRSAVKIYDRDFKPVETEVVKSFSMGGARPSGPTGPRPSLEVWGGRVFVGDNGDRTAEVYVYNW